MLWKLQKKAGSSDFVMNSFKDLYFSKQIRHQLSTVVRTHTERVDRRAVIAVIVVVIVGVVVIVVVVDGVVVIAVIVGVVGLHPCLQKAM